MKSFKKVLAGMANREVDVSTAAYLNFLTSKVSIEEIRNFHVFVSKYLVDHLNEHAPNQGDELLERIEKTLDEKLRESYTAVPKVTSHIRIGLPLRAIESEAKEWNTDLVALGKLKNTNGTFAKNIIRYVECNLLVIPEAATHSLSHILVPVDLSEHSGKILQTALNIQKLAGNEIKITCLHTFDFPDIAFYTVDRTEDKFEQGIRSRMEDAFDKFIMKYTKNHDTNIDKVLIRETIHRPHKYILEYIEKNDVDFVIIGTKSHSAFDAFLGSTAEKVIAKNDKVPLLIIK
jgi:nucleotide-binding universal stress UspA family protein